MYTQCPECGLAFRVTADVLKVAAGKVRCGGCAHPFNALDYLSEEMPEQRAAAPEAEPQLPELKPEPVTKDDGLPESISAAQSAALLKTLDELAGSDIRIEDTGVEWMVLDDEDDSPQSVDLRTPLAEESEPVDEVLDDSPTPVDEFLTSTPEVVDSPEIFDESANAPAQTPVEELRFDDNTPLPENFGIGDEPAVSAPPVDPEPEPEVESEPEPAEPKPDITLSDPHEWTDILDEFEELAGEASRPLDAELDALLDQDEEEAVQEEVVEEEADDDEFPELADDDDETPLEQLVDEEPVDDDTGIEDLDFDADEEDDDLDTDDSELELDEDEDENEDEIEEEQQEDEEDDLAALADDEELDVIDDDPQLDLIEEPVVEEHDIESELALSEEDEDEDDAGDEDSGEHYVPEMSEEEQTVNMQIDQELFAIAVEDEDGFASTMVIPEDRAEEEALESNDDESSDEDDVPEFDGGDTGSGFETIIMEGEEVKTALDEEKRKADVAEAAELQEIAKAAEAEAALKVGGNRYGMIAGVVILVIVLIVQVVHHSREALATNEVFNNTVGPIYRALGKPLQPAWDITGWQFEASRGSAELETDGNSTETSETLTVYSRIGNTSQNPLPYPLIRISLTDRFMEPLGSHVLEPAEYLGDNMDPRKLVEPGDSFEAAIIVSSQAENAKNFTLDVCYRHSDRQLRCKDSNFK